MGLLDAYKPQELASELGVSVHTLNTWRSRKKGPRFVRIAGRIHYMRADVEQWVQEQIAAA
ncbi:TPA: helix-turn-helix domain-containing protein [Corynebacterium striatum]|nr:helix-turn-helix domain-containing protein [Corynebacterium striatum]